MNKFLIILALFFIYINTNGQSPNNTLPLALDCSSCPTSKLTITFADDLDIRSDYWPSGGGDNPLFNGLDYESTGTPLVQSKSNPIAYPSGNFIRISPEIHLNCTNPPSTIWIKAEDSNDKVIIEKKAKVKNSIASFKKSVVTKLLLTANTVNTYELVLNWSVSFDNAKTWSVIGQSKNTLYVTWKKPILIAYSSWMETLYYLGCTSASGETTKSDIIEKVWTKFASLEVKRKDGELMHYYQNPNTGNTETFQLINDTDGQCYTWVSLLDDVLKTQRIDEVDEVFIQPIEEYNFNIGGISYYAGMLIKEYSFSNSLVGQSSSSELAMIKSLFPFTHINAGNITSVGSLDQYLVEVRDEEGKPAQGNGNPIAIFGTHQFAEINGKIYDPSYGYHDAVGNSLLKYQKENIAGFQLNPENPILLSLIETEFDRDLNGDGNKSSFPIDIYCWLFKEASQVTEEINSSN